MALDYALGWVAGGFKQLTMLLHSAGVQSTGGDARGSLATDLQSSRTLSSEVASGDRSTIGGGQRNTASGLFATVCGGWFNSVSGRSGTASGESNTVGAYAAAFGDTNSVGSFSGAIGQDNTAGAYGQAHGRGARAPRDGQRSHSVGYVAVQGDRQDCRMSVSTVTTDATPATLSPGDAGVGAAASDFRLAAGQSVTIRGLVIAKDSAGNVARWAFTAGADRIAGANITVAADLQELTAIPAGWAFDLSANAGSQALRLTATGVPATTIRWACLLDWQHCDF